MENIKLKIVVIDKNPDSSASIILLIEKALPGTEVFTSLSGLLGVELIKSKAPDIILIDVSMVEEYGEEASRLIKIDKSLQIIPVLFITDMEAERELLIRAIETGAEAFLVKPLNEMVLLTQLKAMAKIKERNILINDKIDKLEEKVGLRTFELKQEIIKREKSEKMLLEAQRLAHIGSFEFDVASNSLTCTDEGLSICGIKRKEFYGEPDTIIRCIHPDDREYAIQVSEQAVSEKNALEYNCRMVKPDGEERNVNVQIMPVFDVNGKHIKDSGTIQDITERKKVEAKIIHLASFPRLNPEPVIELNQDGSISYANSAAKNIFPDIESVGTHHPFLLNWQTALTQLLAQKNDPLMQEIMVGDRIYSQTFQYIEPSNTIRIYSHDITERKTAEKQLKESEKLFRTSFESATAGVAMLGKDGMFTMVNDRACELFGYTREELLQKKLNDITYEEDRSLSTDVLNKLIHGDLNHAVIEKRYLRKDKKVIWALVSISAIRDDNNGVEYFVGYIQDITESKLSVEKINKTLEGTIETLALVVEARDPYTSGHQKRVAEIAVAIAENMGFSKSQIHGLYLASIVHDIGKIQIPAEILNKPGTLTNLEFELIKCHPKAGYDLLKGIEFPWPLAEIVYQHHEKIDGSGYPRKLKGDSILIEAKILSVADVVEAMSSHRPYRAALTKDAALAEIEKNKGVLYDPDVVEACLKVYENRKDD